MCSSPVQYATISGTCQLELANILTSSNCSPDPDGNIFVGRNEEEFAPQLINGLNFIGASAECKEKAVSFFCLHLFGLCIESGVSIQPTAGQCEEIRDIICQKEWVTIEQFGMDLPDCEMFPIETSSCIEKNNHQSTNGSANGNMIGMNTVRNIIITVHNVRIMILLLLIKSLSIYIFFIFIQYKLFYEL